MIKLLTCFHNQFNTSSGDPVVVTHLGRVRGRTLDKAHVFYGIPYADPPVGDKRWAPPSSVSPWTYTYDATFPRPACMQVCAGEFSRMCPPKVSEDCLYLNVFVPVSVNLSLPIVTALPVMVWIHGGDFIAGSASKPLYDGRFISNYSNTVVVNMEYRLVTLCLHYQKSTTMHAINILICVQKMNKGLMGLERHEGE
uniref:Carboxylesterase type B domain-containing protein n=1 Tax=Sinocyclocheilus rhinocerous TaxID=307959 RepID=A0A673N5P4_9TELE